MYCIDTPLPYTCALCPTRGRQTPLEITLKSSATQHRKKTTKLHVDPILIDFVVFTVVLHIY